MICCDKWYFSFLIYLLQKQPSKKHFQTKFNYITCLFSYRSRIFFQKKEVAEWLNAWILYVHKILTFILHFNWEIVLFPFKILASSVGKFLDIAEPLIARIMFWYQMLKITYFFSIFGFCLWVGHMHAADHYREKLEIALQSAGITKWHTYLS